MFVQHMTGPQNHLSPARRMRNEKLCLRPYHEGSPPCLFFLPLSVFLSLCLAVHLRQIPHTRLRLSKWSSVFVLRSLHPKRTRQKVERKLQPQRARSKQKAKKHHSPSNHLKKTILTFFQSYSRYTDMSNTPR
jgi:hypothetical protein